MAPAKLLGLPFAQHRGEAPGGAPGGRPPIGDESRMERVGERHNLLRALARVTANGGSPGLDGLTGAAWPDSLRHHGPEIRVALLAGRYRPSPVRRVDLPKPGGGVRHLGIPTVLARLLQQAVLHVLQPAWDTTCAVHSYGLRPGRSAHQAIARAPQYLEAGYDGVVALELAKCFDRVHHEKVMRLVKGRRADRRVLHLIDRSLKAGALTGDGFEAPGEGMPQGGPLSPLGAHLLLDGCDQELERRGPRCVRYADESNISVTSLRAGQRVLARGTRCLERRLQRTVHAVKRAVDRPWRRTFLGFTCTRRWPIRRQVSVKALQARKQEVRQRTDRTRGVSAQRVVDDLRQSLEGGDASCRVAEVQSTFQALDSWVRRRLRCSGWKHWGRRRSRERRTRGVSQDLAGTRARRPMGRGA